MLFSFLENPFEFSISDTTNFGFYENGGTVIEVKKPQIIHFVSFCCIYCSVGVKTGRVTTRVITFEL